MIIVYNNNLINITDDLKRSGLDESLTPIFTRIIVGDVKKVFFRNKEFRRWTTTSANAGDNKMRRKTSTSRSVNSVDAEFHHQGSRYSLRANNQSAETAYKLNEREVAKEKTCVANYSNFSALTAKQRSQEKWDYELDLINRFTRLEKILGRNPELAELADAGFSREEIDLMETLTDGITSDDLEEWEPISTPRLIAGRGLM